MSDFSDKHDQAGARYVAAVAEFRSAYVNLAAFDRKAGAPGFGVPVEIVPLRHARYLPDLSGAMSDGIADALAKL